MFAICVVHKILPVILISIFIALTTQEQDPEFKKLWHGYRSECCKENGVDLDYVKKIWKSNHFPSNDSNLNCYYKCLSLKVGILTEAGEVVDDMLTKLMGELLDDAATEAEVTRECGNIQGSDLCLTGLKLMACVRAAEVD